MWMKISKLMMENPRTHLNFVVAVNDHEGKIAEEKEPHHQENEEKDKGPSVGSVCRCPHIRVICCCQQYHQIQQRRRVVLELWCFLPKKEHPDICWKKQEYYQQDLKYSVCWGTNKT